MCLIPVYHLTWRSSQNVSSLKADHHREIKQVFFNKELQTLIEMWRRSERDSARLFSQKTGS